MGAVTWTAYSSAQDLGSNLQLVADGAEAIGTNAIDNTTGAYRWADLYIIAGSNLSATNLDASIHVFFVNTYDGTNYVVPGSNSGTVTGGQWKGCISSVEVIGTPTATPFRSGVLERISLPPTKFKVRFVNELGVTTDASMGAFLYMYNETVA